MNHEIRHDLEPELAKRAALKAVEAYGQRFTQFDFKHSWADDGRMEFEFTVAGQRLTGSLAIGDVSYVLELEVPFLFRVFRGKAVDIIEREVSRWVDKVKTGALDLPSPGSGS